MAASAEVASYLRADFESELAELALWICNVVIDAEEDLSNYVNRGWRAVGFKHPLAGYVCGVFPKGDVVELFFEHGAALPDPEGVLSDEGRLRKGRVINVAEASPALAAMIGAYVSEAVAYGLSR